MMKGCSFYLCTVLAVLAMGLSESEATGGTSSQRQKWLDALPDNVILHAPYTPFKDDEERSFNATKETVDKLAALAKQQGVNLVWVPGSMGQFQTLTDEERKLLVEYWVEAGHKHGIYIVAHVGSNSIERSRALAVHAEQVGADAIASVPPFYLYEPQSTAEQIDVCLDFLKQISDAAPTLPFFYYHIVPNVFQKSITLFLEQASVKFPNLIGIKWVELDNHDWFTAVSRFNDSYALLFAPEPKIASFGLGSGRGVVLAEDFFAQTYLKMQAHYLQGDIQSAREEQAWKYSAMGIFSKYGGGSAERLVYERFIDVDLGTARRPWLPFTGNKAALFAELEGIGFFNMSDNI
jgi:N-acetylneuraminate lyase